MTSYDRSGIYHDISTADYLADPAPAPSFTQSLAKTLLDKSPLHAWYSHPKLNPDYDKTDETRFDLGSTAHSLLLGRGKEILIAEGFDDWRTKASREFREQAAAAGKLAILQHQYDRAARMVDVAHDLLVCRAPRLFHFDWHAETMLLWQEDVWLRQLLDGCSPDFRIVADYKTTDENAAPHAIPRKMASDGWAIQAAMAERGLDKLHPASAGKRKYFFVCQETAAPYELTVTEIGEGALTMGRKQLDYAITVWTRCMADRHWPGYPLNAIRADYPAWAENQWLEREEIDRV